MRIDKYGVPHYTLEEYRKMAAGEDIKPAATPEAAKPQNKYGAQKTTVDAIKFDSKAEAKRYKELLLLKQSGDITCFSRQPSFILAGGVRYRPDFIVCDKDNRIWVEDVKGHETKEFVIKAKLFREEYPYLPLEIIRKEN